MAELEGADKFITLKCASKISGIGMRTLAGAAKSGRLAAEKPGHDYLTTRRNLHRYLANRSRGVIKELPADYVTPEGEEQVK
jgi:hypothetical protein